MPEARDRGFWQWHDQSGRWQWQSSRGGDRRGGGCDRRGRGFEESHSYLRGFSDGSDEEFRVDPVMISGKGAKEMDTKLRKRLGHFDKLARGLDLAILSGDDGFGSLPAEVLAQVIGCLGTNSRDLRSLACTNKHFGICKEYYATWCIVNQLADKKFILWHPTYDVVDDTSSRMLLKLFEMNTRRAKQIELSMKKLLKDEDEKGIEDLTESFKATRFIGN